MCSHYRGLTVSCSQLQFAMFAMFAKKYEKLRFQNSKNIQVTGYLPQTRLQGKGPLMHITKLVNKKENLKSRNSDGRFPKMVFLEPTVSELFHSEEWS